MGEGGGGGAAALWCNGAECLSTRGLSLIRDCTFSVGQPAPAIVVQGDGTIVEGNVLDNEVRIYGNSNIVAHNYSSGGTYIEVRGGTGNILDGNIGLGIIFESTGNFYGNNRTSGGFIGTEGQTDWGGNVTY